MPGDRTILDRFLADNPELEELSARLARFNVFRALGIEHHEIRHSNVLAWLMDPSENHGLGQLPLRRLLSSLLLDWPDRPTDLSAADVELMDLDDAEIRREWRHIDIFLVSRRNKLAVLIENKVRAGESSGQLSRYRKAVEAEFPGFRLVPVLLTRDGSDVTDPDEAGQFATWSYSSVLGTVETLFKQRHSQLGPEVVAFLEHYLDVLRRLTMQDEKFVGLCRAIYRKHREAIDAIVEYGQVSMLGEVVTELLSERGGYEIGRVRPSSVHFLPKPWLEFIPQGVAIWDHHERRPVSCWIDLWENRLRLHFEACRTDDETLLPKLSAKLANAGFKSKKDPKQYMRFYNLTENMADGGDPEELAIGVRKLLDKAGPQIVKAGPVLKEFFSKHD